MTHAVGQCDSVNNIDECHPLRINGADWRALRSDLGAAAITTCHPHGPKRGIIVSALWNRSRLCGLCL